MADATAVSVELLPLQTVAGLAVTLDMVTAAATVTVAVAVFTQPFASVPVTVYVWVAEGLALTGVPVVADKPDAGLHA